MPLTECSVTDERLRFVARLLDGEGMSEVCRDFGISRTVAGRPNFTSENMNERR
jgi:hypothetical protein